MSENKTKLICVDSADIWEQRYQVTITTDQNGRVIMAGVIDTYLGATVRTYKSEGHILDDIVVDMAMAAVRTENGAYRLTKQFVMQRFVDDEFAKMESPADLDAPLDWEYLVRVDGTVHVLDSDNCKVTVLDNVQAVSDYKEAVRQYVSNRLKFFRQQLATVG